MLLEIREKHKPTNPQVHTFCMVVITRQVNWNYRLLHKQHWGCKSWQVSASNRTVNFLVASGNDSGSVLKAGTGTFIPSLIYQVYRIVFNTGTFLRLILTESACNNFSLPLRLPIYLFNWKPSVLKDKRKNSTYTYTLLLRANNLICKLVIERRVSPFITLNLYSHKCLELNFQSFSTFFRYIYFIKTLFLKNNCLPLIITSLCIFSSK